MEADCLVRIFVLMVCGDCLGELERRDGGGLFGLGWETRTKG